MPRTCECTSLCGDDPNVTGGIVLGCATYRARRSPASQAERLAKLRGSLQGLVSLMDRLEPDVADDVREQAEAEWDTCKANAVALLRETE